MKSFEELVREGELEYCVSGHCFDSALTFQDMLNFYRNRSLREENAEFRGSIMRGTPEVGSKFYVDDLLVVHVHSSPKNKRLSQAKEFGLGELKSHIEIHPGEEYYRKDGLSAAQRELISLMQYHIAQKIPAACYVPYNQEFQGINKV
ncbi:MAG TPA: hypothetical protein VJB90_01515 [Candidatus Nanoarchaeia archaeon]|nr:hypothetical protein [Candidatus Nanoarchaeia archaeon]